MYVHPYDLENFEYIDPEYADYYFLTIILIVLLIVIFTKVIQIIINYIKERQNEKKSKKWNYRVIKRKKENIKAKQKYKEKVQPYKNYDPEMFSNEPLDFEKAGNLKYKAHIEDMNRELKKNHYF
ncbi:MAG: hypothetical protein J5527_05195 [Treponema sp.]|nr:hypothetical protein [Treponema sp.]